MLIVQTIVIRTHGSGIGGRLAQQADRPGESTMPGLRKGLIVLYGG